VDPRRLDALVLLVHSLAPESAAELLSGVADGQREEALLELARVRGWTSEARRAKAAVLFGPSPDAVSRLRECSVGMSPGQRAAMLPNVPRALQGACEFLAPPGCASVRPPEPSPLMKRLAERWVREAIL
jgi:hypothetical protein